MRKFILYLGDIAVFYLSLYLTLIIRYGTGDRFVENLDIHLTPFTIILIIWILVYYIANLYEIDIAKNNLSFFSLLLYAAVVNALLAVFFFYLVPFFGITPKTNLFIFIAVISVLGFSWRWLFNKVTALYGYRSNTLIIGFNPQSQELYDFILSNPQLGNYAIGILDVTDRDAANILEKLIKQKNVKNLVISPEAYKIPPIVDILYRLLGLKINFYNLSDFYEQSTGKIPLGAIDQVWFLDNLTEGRKRFFNLTKRLLDIVFSLILGIISLFLFLFIIPAIKIGSPGPVFYRQQRKGQAGRILTITKFRTMIPNAETDGAKWAQVYDPRVTNIGSFLRRTRLDELPQLWNVLRGEMSFVGPRPERPEFHDRLKSTIPFYDERYLIKPGLTGWAQIKYKYGASLGESAEKLQYDLYYVKNRSLLLDVGIILKTINIILRRAGT